MEMNVGMLKKVLEHLPDDMQVFVGCQGYCNYDFKEGKPYRDTDTFGIVYDGKLFITDACAIETETGETI
jgi:hypothetical protein